MNKNFLKDMQMASKHMKRWLAINSCHLIAKSCLTLFNPVDCSPPGSSINGVFQARTHWNGLPFPSSGGLLTQGSNPHLCCRLILYHWATWEAWLILMSRFSSGVISRNSEPPGWCHCPFCLFSPCPEQTSILNLSIDTPWKQTINKNDGLYNVLLFFF